MVRRAGNRAINEYEIALTLDFHARVVL